jgi:hypothetical protein
MRLATTFVSLRKVKPTASRWSFSDAELEAAAQLVLEVEGIINPIVVQPEESSDSYVILDGNFAYYAVAKANQIDARRCESIEAFVIEPRDTAIIQKQIALFRQHSTQNRLLLDFAAYGSASNDQNLQKPSSPPHRLLDIFNAADSTQIMQQIKRIGLTGKNAEKIVEAIEYERQAGLFTSLKEIVARVKGLTYEKMLDLIEAE